MFKPRIFIWFVAIGTGLYALWRWQKQRLIDFDQSLFQNNDEHKNLLGGARVAAPAPRGRPVQTTIHRKRPDGQQETPPNTNGENKPRRIPTRVHKGEPPKDNLPPTNPHFLNNDPTEENQEPSNEPASPEPAAPPAPEPEPALVEVPAGKPRDSVLSDTEPRSEP